MLKKMNIEEFLEELASDSPAPGGGSVAALTGAAGASLGEMVCSLTLGKKKYADVRDEIAEKKAELEKVRKRLVELMDIDTDAFNLVMDAIKMPKETEEQKKERREAMQRAFRKAAEVPLETAERSLEAMRHCVRVREIGNRNAKSDAEISVMLCHLGVKGAILNVRINLESIKDEDFVGRTESRLREIEDEAERLAG